MQKWMMYAAGALVAFGVAGLAVLVSAYVLIAPPQGIGTTPALCCGPVALMLGLLALLCAFMAYKEHSALAPQTPKPNKGK